MLVNTKFCFLVEMDAAECKLASFIYLVVFGYASSMALGIAMSVYPPF